MNSIQFTFGTIVAVVVAACTLAAPIREPIGPTLVEPPQSHLDWSTTYVEINLDGKPWSDVLEWFAAKTGMAIDPSNNPPQGVLTVTTPRGRKYTLAEIYDLINRRATAEEKRALLRGASTIAFFPADDVTLFPPHLISRVQVEDLPRRPQSEIVDVFMSRRGARGAELEPFEPVSKGRFTTVRVIEALENDCVEIRSDVATLRRLCNVGPR